MFKGTIVEIFNNVWPTLVLVTVIIVSLRLAYLVKYKPKFVFYKDMIYYAFILYILCLFYVVTFQDVSWSTSNYIPFKEMFRYNFGTRMFFKNVVGNMMMFIPYGFFIAYILKLKKVRTATLLSLLVSLTIETTQLIIGRVFDVDDIILNIVGGIIGFYAFKIIYSLKTYSPEFLKKDIIYNILMIVIIIIMIIYLFWVFEVSV